MPGVFDAWFAARGWAPRDHQLDMAAAGAAGRSALLIAPTGAGKTLAGFLPSLVDLHENGGGAGLHTLYISPLKALAVDIARNVEAPVREMALNVTLETRTGDTPPAKRKRQRETPPDLLLTTPEQVALMLAAPDAGELFASLRCVILDEIHALIDSKRGHLLGLGLARLRRYAPRMRTVGLSATVPDPEPLLAYLTPQPAGPRNPSATLVRAAKGAEARVSVLHSEERIPWSGHSARHAWGELYAAIRAAKMTLVFVNTRSQAELTFQALWRLNEDNLPIALHHGSLDVARRRKVEAAMARGDLRAVVCTSTLDLGIDWGDVDLVVQIGAPKGASRLTQRIGRANHRMDEPSRALLVPSNRLEVLECQAARDAILEGALDGPPPRKGALDVLCQHILGVACAEPFDADDLYREVASVSLYADLPRATFDDALKFVETGGYALANYDRYRRVVKDASGRYRVRDKRVAAQYRMNVGTIVEAPTLTVRLAAGKGPKRPGRALGTIEEWLVEQLAPGDTFLFAGEVLRFEGVAGVDAMVSRAAGEMPRVPSWAGGKFPLSTYLAGRVRAMIHDPSRWADLPDPVREWLERQHEVSVVPDPGELLVETFEHAGRHFLVCYPFDGQLAHQTLGTLITRRLEREGRQPFGFVAGEYALSVWARQDMGGVDMARLFDADMLGDDLEAWLAQSILMKRTFRNCAVIAGLIERRAPGQEKSGRQVTFSTDLLYDVLREHEPDHILLRAAWDDAAGGFLDIARLSALLSRVSGRVNHVQLDRVSPLAVPVMLEINRQQVAGEAQEAMLRDAALAESEAALVEAAMERRTRGL
ncbi:MAG: ligase-associated DNA damage response DEXH box helicase [Pseudomonadota bacterium]